MSRNPLQATLIKIIEPVVQAAKLELVDVRFLLEQGGWTLRVQIDVPVETITDVIRRTGIEVRSSLARHLQQLSIGFHNRVGGSIIQTKVVRDVENVEQMLQQVGQAWEWTSSHFHGYPGFVAHPYREYSEVFFGDVYRVLRGASWATEARVRSPHFRNWDLPQRRQIFAGVRLAKDVS